MQQAADFSPEPRQVEETNQEQTEHDHSRQGGECCRPEMGVARVNPRGRPGYRVESPQCRGASREEMSGTFNGSVEMVDAFEDDERPTERQRQVARYESPDAGAE